MSDYQPVQPPSRRTLLVMASILLTYVAFGYWLDSYRVPRWYQAFHAARLRGTIRHRTVGKSTTSLVLDNGQEYVFFPVDGLGHSQKSEFGLVVAPGDSVYKTSGSDTLYVVTKGGRRFFVGDKP